MMELRTLVYDDPLEAVALAVRAGDVEKDYVTNHFNIDPIMLQWFGMMARAAICIKEDQRIEKKYLVSIPEVALHQFACDCAIRALSKGPNFKEKYPYEKVGRKRRWIKSANELLHVEENFSIPLGQQDAYKSIENATLQQDAINGTWHASRYSIISVARRIRRIRTHAWHHNPEKREIGEEWMWKRLYKEKREIEEEWQWRRLYKLCERVITGRIKI